MTEIDMTNVRLLNALTDHNDLIAGVVKALGQLTTKVEALYARVEALERRTQYIDDARPQPVVYVAQASPLAGVRWSGMTPPGDTA